MKSARIKVKLITGEVLTGDEISVAEAAYMNNMSEDVAEAEVNRVLNIISKPGQLGSLQMYVGGVEYNLSTQYILYVMVERN